MTDVVQSAARDMSDLLSDNDGEKLVQTKTQLIQDSLRFHEMSYRKDIIADSHQKTFNWAFDKTSTPFGTWLESGDGIFWICGKAGSGKSTLMKFLTDDYRTRSSIITWSPGTVNVIADHYFWYAGSPMQKSHQGLLQSILHQIFTRAAGTGIIERLCIGRWNSSDDEMSRPWSRRELWDTLQRIGECSFIKVCIFVDGLDEYCPNSDHGQLVTELTKLSRIPNVKLCVPSRPWNDFSIAFERMHTQLRLEDLTREDIARYTRDQLNSADSGRILTNDLSVTHADLENIVTQITRKANGVFLWVYLAVSALKERISARSSLEKLQRCIEDFPEELEDYFRVCIYARINKTWKNDMAQALKMAVLIISRLDLFEVREGKDGISYLDFNSAVRLSRFGSDRYDCLALDQSYLSSFLPFWLLYKGLDKPDFAQSQELQCVSLRQLQQMNELTAAHMNACCKDLLYIPKPRETSHFDMKYVVRRDIFKTRVEFLHRTVYDFLTTEEMHDLLDRNVPVHFKADAFLVDVSVACLKFVLLSDGSMDGDLCPIFSQNALAAMSTLPDIDNLQLSNSSSSSMESLRALDTIALYYMDNICTGKCDRMDSALVPALNTLLELVSSLPLEKSTDLLREKCRYQQDRRLVYTTVPSDIPPTW